MAWACQYHPGGVPDLLVGPPRPLGAPPPVDEGLWQATCPRAQSLVAALDLALNPVPVVGELRGAPGGVPVVAGDALLVHRPLVSEGEHAGLAGHGGQPGGEQCSGRLPSIRKRGEG